MIFYIMVFKKLKLRVFLTGCTVAMVTYYTTKINIIGLPMAGHLCNTEVVGSAFVEFKNVLTHELLGKYVTDVETSSKTDTAM